VTSSSLSEKDEQRRLRRQLHFSKNIEGSTYTPFSHRRSVAKSGLAVTVVIALRSSWFIVTDTLELIGRLRETSRLPQYLMTAMLDGAEWVAAIDMVLFIAVRVNKVLWLVEPTVKNQNLTMVCTTDTHGTAASVCRARLAVTSHVPGPRFRIPGPAAAAYYFKVELPTRTRTTMTASVMNALQIHCQCQWVGY
jgi:hypothetical protein